MENWTNLHPNFGEKEWVTKKTYKQFWEEQNLSYQDAQEWIPAGFKPKDYERVDKWKLLNFTPQQTRLWVKKGLNKDDHKFAFYLRFKNHFPNSDLNLKELREKYKSLFKDYSSKPAQEYLDWFYLKEQKNTITSLKIDYKNLTGNLDLSDFVNLRELDCSHNNLTSLKLDNCKKLKRIDCSSNQLAKLEINHLTNLILLNCGNNQLTEQDLSVFSELKNLKELNIGNNPITGSLKPLENLEKLRGLNISDTDIDSGLEYLSESISFIFANEKKVETDGNGSIKNFSKKLLEYKQKVFDLIWFELPKQEIQNQEHQKQELKTKLNQLNTKINYLQGKLNKVEETRIGNSLIKKITTIRIEIQQKEKMLFENQQTQIIHNPPKST